MTQKIEVTNYVNTIAAHVQTIIIISITILLSTYVSKTTKTVYLLIATR